MKRIFCKLHIFHHENTKVQYNLNHQISSFIYKELIFELNLHDTNTIKEFNFCLKFEKTKSNKNEILLNSNNAALIISTTSSTISDCIIKNININININKILKIGDILFEIEEYKIQEDILPDGSVYYRTLTPIVIEKPTILKTINNNSLKEYLHPKHEEFKTRLIDNLNRKTNNTENIDIFYDANKARQKLVSIKTQKIRCYHLDFILKANSKIHNCIYYNGAGVKNGQGFGMLEILEIRK